MSTAPEHPIRRASRRWDRILVVLGVCLPIPLCAATGLSIPLPAPVERLAVALVPWADAATLDGNEALTGGENGSIVHAPGEGPGDGQEDSEDAAAVSADPQPGASDRTDKKSEGSGGKDDPSTTDPGGEEPSDDPDLLADTVDEVEETTDPVVDEIDGAVSDIGETVDDVVSGLGG
jgi:hypothetical protein